MDDDGRVEQAALRAHRRAHDDDRQRYEATKRDLATRAWAFVQDYADAKTDVVEEICAPANRWSVRTVGDLELLGEEPARRLREAVDSTVNNGGFHVNVAVGYGGRQEITDAVRALLGKELANGATAEQLVDSVTVEAISENLYTSGQPDPDLVIRTSGEQRLSGFLLWQSAYSEMWFTEAHWPAFRRVDFLRALRDYTRRHRRYGM